MLIKALLIFGHSIKKASKKILTEVTWSAS